jgi:hypothetical protein
LQWLYYPKCYSLNGYSNGSGGGASSSSVTSVAIINMLFNII